MKEQPTFIHLCNIGAAVGPDIHHFIDQWHEAKTDIPIHEYLGMSADHYQQFVNDETSLPGIIDQYRGIAGLHIERAIIGGFDLVLCFDVATTTGKHTYTVNYAEDNSKEHYLQPKEGGGFTFVEPVADLQLKALENKISDFFVQWLTEHYSNHADEFKHIPEL